MRNLGGSFGISLAVSLLSRRDQFHHAILGGTVSVFSRARTAGSLAAFAREVEKQAEMWSYIDVFMFLAVLAACMIPITFLLKTLKPEETHAAA